LPSFVAPPTVLSRCSKIKTRLGLYAAALQLQATRMLSLGEDVFAYPTNAVERDLSLFR